MRGSSLSSRNSTSSSPRTRRAAFTLLELTVVIAIFTVSVLMFTQTMVASSRMDPISEETTVAAEAAAVRVEEMRAVPFDQIFRRFNVNPADDPGGAGTAQGADFAVPGLRPPAGSAFVGHIEFPTVGNALREDVDDVELSMPRDLDNDGLVDSADHAADAIILPVRVRLEWLSRTGRHGKRSLTLHAMFCKL